MKQFSFGKRFVSWLLVLVTVVTLLPLGTIASFAVNKDDIVISENRGVTGIKTDTLNKNGTINWPIKLYDNLADGMLFEFAQYGGSTLSSSSKTYSDGGGQYVLGQPMPYTTYKHYDFTTEAAYASGVNKNYTDSETKSHQKSHAAAVDYSSPRYMRIKRAASGYNTSYKNCLITDFGADLGGIGNAEQNRYMLWIYRASGLSATSNDTHYIGINTNSAANGWSRLNDGGIKDVNGNYVRNTDGKWKAVIIDIAANCSSTQWKNFKNRGFDDIYVRLGLDSASDYIDFAYVGYFPSTATANEFANQAFQFMAEPGE